jgi:hypothetical protein
MKHKLLPYFLKNTDIPMGAKGWQKEGKEPLNLNKLLFFYDLIFDVVYAVLDTVFTPFLKKPTTFVTPDPVLVNDYETMLDLLYQIEEQWQFKHILTIDLKEFDTISGDYQRMLTVWKVKGGTLLDHKAQIKKMMFLHGVVEYPISKRLQLALDVVYKKYPNSKEVSGTANC